MVNNFKTFKDLEQYLKGHTDLCMTRKYLQDKVKAEITFLVKDIKSKHPTILWTAEETLHEKQAATAAAQDDYLEDINYFLVKNVKLTHMSVMGYRRKSHAWAIADAIQEFQKEQL